MVPRTHAQLPQGDTQPGPRTAWDTSSTRGGLAEPSLPAQAPGGPTLQRAGLPRPLDTPFPQAVCSFQVHPRSDQVFLRAWSPPGKGGAHSLNSMEGCWAGGITAPPRSLQAWSQPCVPSLGGACRVEVFLSVCLPLHPRATRDLLGSAGPGGRKDLGGQKGWAWGALSSGAATSVSGAWQGVGVSSQECCPPISSPGAGR